MWRIPYRNNCVLSLVLSIILKPDTVPNSFLCLVENSKYGCWVFTGSIFMANQAPIPPGRFEFCGVFITVFFRLAIGLGFSILMSWLILRPHKPRYYVDYASLSQLNLTEKAPSSRMEFNVTVRNPNGKMGIYYHKMEWNVYYEDQRIATSYLLPFHQHRKNTTFLHPAFTGPPISGKDQKNSSRGAVEMILRLHSKVRFKIWFLKSWDLKMRVKCDHIFVNVYQNNSHGSNSFNRTRCSVAI